MNRTYSRQTFEAARAAWHDGHFSEEWEPYRALAAQRGFLYPPSGDAYDSWSDDEPSQRALLIRAIRETPGLLADLIRSSRSWGEVVGQLMRQRDEWRELDDLETAYTRRQRATDEPDHIESATSVAVILRRLWDSAA